MSQTGLRFLIVEDNPADARLVVNELSKAGYHPEILRADTEEEYLDQLAALPDLILCDYSLPQFDALRALELLRERSLEIPFIIVSGSIGEETAVRAIKLGATDYLLKDRLGRLGPVVRHSLEETAFRNAEREAQEKLARDALLLANVRDSIIVTDNEGVVTYWNEGATRIFGWTAEEMVGCVYIDRLQEPLRSFTREKRSEVLNGAEWSADIEDVHRDGHRLWLHVRVVAIQDSTNRTVGLLGISQDISERKRAEAERDAAQTQREQILRDREAILMENARLLRAVAETAVQQRQFLKDVLSSVTEGRLTLCESQTELPPPLAVSPSTPGSIDMSPDPVVLTTSSLRQIRRQVEDIATACGLPKERQWDFIMAVSEAAMNTVVHAGGGMGRVFGNAETEKLQVWIVDQGKGIELASLPRATLERGYSTAGTLGHGFWMILQTCDRVYLLTGPLGTTVVLEQSVTQPRPAWMPQN